MNNNHGAKLLVYSLSIINLAVFVMYIFIFELNFVELFNILKHPFIITIIVFILTKVLGSSIAHQYQVRTYRYQMIDRKLVDQMKLATDLFEELSSLMDKRLYLSRKLMYSFNDVKNGLNDKREERFSDFNNFLYEWNYSLNKNICKLEQLFGKEIKRKFEDRIMPDFNWIGMLLRRKFFGIDKVPSIFNIDKAIDITNERVYKLDQEMLEKLKSEKVGSFI